MFVLPDRCAETAPREPAHPIPVPAALAEILNRLPYMAMLLTAGREIVFANQTLLDSLGLANLQSALAQRPGELLLCVHSRSHSRGCGGAEGCRHCQAAQTIDEALQTGSKVVREARVSAHSEGRLVAYDLRVTAIPVELSGHELAMVFFEDISAQKRREHLESIFIHDLLNTVSGLQLLIERFHDDPFRTRPAEFSRQVQLLTDEIRAQQILVAAERGELVRDIQCLSAGELISDALEGLRGWSAKRGVELAVEMPTAPVYLATDGLVARRVVLNAVKNAVEASVAGDTVKIAVVGGENIAITVWNRVVMSASTQHQVFQRSFSTKGQGRGLGTYSMRLLMENYLGGTVSFCSAPDGGTTFTLTFPSMRSYLASSG
jgi:signal transduction histidine kinase